MSERDHEQPQAGGSYLRDKDGKLTRADDSAVAAPIADVPEPKPARTSKKEK